MNKKMFWIGFVILISGIVITIIGVLGISRLNGFYGLSLYYSNFSLYGEEYTLFSILLYKFMSKKAPIFREEMNCDKYFNKNGISYLIDGNK